MLNNKVFDPQYSMEAVIFKQRKRDIRIALGGSTGLAKDSNREVAKSIAQVKNIYFKNPEEVYDKKNELELNRRLHYKNNLATTWWDQGANEEKGPPAPLNDKNIVIAAKTNRLAFDNQFNPDPGAKGVQQQSQVDARTSLEILTEIRDKSSKLNRIKRRSRA